MTEDYHEQRELPPIKDYFRSPRVHFGRRRTEIQRQLQNPESQKVTRALLVLAGLGVLFLGYWLYVTATMPSVIELASARQEEASVVLTADGKELTRFYDKNRVWVDLDQISPYVVDALISTEDKRFYSHWGIDVQRTLGSIFHTLSGDTQGGSTITMQFAKNAFPEIGNDFILTRKIKEWVTAVQIEALYSKRDILEMYLNTVPMMYETYGFEAAARTYFQKPVKDLNANEAATLVGMLKGTVMYNPVKNPEAALERRNVVLHLMSENGKLSEAEYERIKDQPIPLHFRRITHTQNMAPYFAEHVRQFVKDWAEKKGYNIYTDGLRIHTTIDSRLQIAANNAVQKMANDMQVVADVEWSKPRPPMYSGSTAAYRNVRQRVEPFSYFWRSNPEVLDTYIKQSEQYRVLSDSLGKKAAYNRLKGDPQFLDSLKTSYQRVQGAFVAIDPKTGHIKAWVGGRNYAEDKYDRVADAKRQPGSTFKPFVYATAIESGYSPDDVLRDEERTYVDRWTKKEWRPTNVDGATGQVVTLRDALARSINTVTAQLITDVGASRVADYAHKMGIESKLDEVPSLGLGTSEVTLLELANAYATLADNGVWHEPVFLTQIENREGKVLATFTTKEKEVISANTAYTVVDMMKGVVDYGTGQRIRGVFGAAGELAGKTGTTQNGADGWFMLIHPNLVMGSWMGFNSPSISFRSPYWEQGAHTALYIVGNFYQQAHLVPARFTPPPGYHVPAPSGRTVLARTTADTSATGDTYAEERDGVQPPRYDGAGEYDEPIPMPGQPVSQPAQGQPVEEQPSEEQPSDEQPAEEKASEEKPEKEDKEGKEDKDAAEKRASQERRDRLKQVIDELKKKDKE